MSEQQSSYRQIMKATSLFGGVQVFNIAIQIIRSKVIAVLLGPAGIGIMGLLTSALGIISNLTNFGLGTSAVKDIATAASTQNDEEVSTIVTVFRRLVWITGTLGALLVLVLSPWLSQFTFGNREYTLAFVWLAVTLLLQQLTSGQLVVLQGLRRLNDLAKANMLGSVLGLIGTLPFYYFLGLDGIVPGLIGTSIITVCISWYFSRKVSITTIKITRQQTVAKGKGMLQMGFMISLSGLITLGASYLVRAYISNKSGLEQVGLYTAGFAIITNYVGLIFNAMATDYYPRLSAVAKSNLLSKQTINQQAEIALLILTPIILAFLVFIQWVVILLYSKQFIAIDAMIHWAALGMLFRAASWAIAFIFLAKGASQLFFWNELIVNIYMLGLNILGYHFMGLTGLGISFLVAYVLYFIQVFVLSKIKYQFSFDAAFIRIFTIQILLAVSCFLIITFMNKPYSIFTGTVLIAISLWYSYKELDKRLDIKGLITTIKKRF